MRSQGYLSRIVADQFCVGDLYEFNPVVQVMLTNHVPQIQKNDGYLHDYRYTKEEKAVPLPDGRCRILWVEMDKLEVLEKKPVEEWRLSEKIHYTVRFSHVAEKQKWIQELSEKEEIIHDNDYTGEKCDWERLGGGRWKTQWRNTRGVRIDNTFSFSALDQGGYPYARCV